MTMSTAKKQPQKRNKKQTQVQQLQTAPNVTKSPSPAKQQQQHQHHLQKQDTNHKITEYFQIRKSSRRCKSDIEKERKAFIEKAILNQLEEGLEVKLIENKGRGVFASKSFHKDDFIVEYSGELISMTEAKKREETYSEDSTVGCYMYYFEFKSKKYCIDATAESGRLGRLLNHSKTNSNCYTKLYEIDAQPALAILAARDIKMGEELTYDYGDRSKFTLEAHPWLLE